MTPHSTTAVQRRYREAMVLKAKVTDGRLVLDVPTDLPEGTEIKLAPIDPHDAMTAKERERLRTQIIESIASPESDDADAETLFAEIAAMRNEAPVGG